MKLRIFRDRTGNVSARRSVRRERRFRSVGEIQFSHELTALEQRALMAAGLPDLNATLIERLPRYDYNAPKNVPAAGDNVTFVAHVRCWDGPVQTATYKWLIDNVTVATGELHALGEDELRTVSLPWVWQTGTHKVEFVLDDQELVQESTELNNKRELETDAVTIGFWVEQSVYDYFQANQHKLGIGANSWEDWAQRHVDLWNQYNREAIYPTSPQGVLESVRLDKIVVVPDGALPLAGGLATNNPDLRDRTVDLIWGFPRSLLDGDMYMNTMQPEPWNAFYHEGSLIHELGHARYLIDNYGFDVHKHQMGILENGKPVAGSPLMPFLAWDSVLYYNQYGGIMAGPWNGWSPYEAMCLNLIAGKRASQGNSNAPGNIGVFLKDIPATNLFTILDPNGVPLSNAEIKVYRPNPRNEWYGKFFDNTPDLSFSTDASGVVVFGRDLFSSGPIVHTYGQTNGIVVLRIEKASEVWYRFVELPAFNMEYWKGNTETAQYTLRLNDPAKPGSLSVEGFGKTIANGDSTPNLADHTDFGTLEAGEKTLRRQFVMRNDGGSPIRIRNISIEDPAGIFRVLNPGNGSIIHPETLTGLLIEFSPVDSGTYDAVVSIELESESNPYRFKISGNSPESGGFQFKPIQPVRILEGQAWASKVLYTKPAGVSDARLVLVDGPANSKLDPTTETLNWTPSDNSGPYTVRLRLESEQFPELTTDTSFEIRVENVAPTIVLDSPTAAIFGSPWTLGGSWIDPGLDTWTGTVNYGEGSPPSPLSLNPVSKRFSLNRTYAKAGNYTVTVSLQDDDGGVATQSFRVFVTSPLAKVLSMQINSNRRAINYVDFFFDQKMDRITTGDSRNYRITSAGRDGIFGTRDDRNVRISRVRYTDNSRSVRIFSRGRMRLPGSYQFTLIAENGSRGIKSADGRLLDGDEDQNPGGHYVRRYGPNLPS